VQQAYDNLINCLDGFGYFDCFDNYPEDTPEREDCLDDAYANCMAEHYACWPAGDGNCVDLYLCIVSCPEDDADQKCLNGCFDDASEPALALWDLFIDCLGDHGYFDCQDGDTECYGAAWDLCDVEFKECAHGEYTCNEILECQQDCPDDDTICATQCIVYGSIQGQNMFDAIVDCIVEQCGEDATVECQNDAIKGKGLCAKLFDTCIDT